MNLAKFCNDIQHNADLSIIKIVEEHLTEQNKCKNSNNNKKIQTKISTHGKPTHFTYPY